MIPFNIPPYVKESSDYIAQAIANRKICGDGPFTKRCNQQLEEMTGACKALLTTSGTSAMELAALLLVLVLLGSMAYFTVSVLHLITQLAVNSACDLMQLKINAAVTAAQAQVQGDYYTYRTDADGTITAVSIDTEHVGQVSSLVLEHMMDGDDGQVELDIPLETLFGVNFLPGLKLPLPVRILVLTTSDVSYHNELVSAAINQSKYQLYLNVKMDLDILVPWEHQTETVGTNVLLAETVIVGKVPQTYVEVE